MKTVAKLIVYNMQYRYIRPAFHISRYRNSSEMNKQILIKLYTLKNQGR